MNNEHFAYLGLGSNIGKKEQTLKDALTLIGSHDAIQITAVSAIYETAPVGYTDQPVFLNCVCRIATTLHPLDLLRTMMDVERQFGRQRTIRWGPRTLDIDILLFDDMEIQSEELTVPHPRMMERAFVLVPLLEIMPGDEQEWKPGFKHLQLDHNGVKRWTSFNWPEEYGPSAN